MIKTALVLAAMASTAILAQGTTRPVPSGTTVQAGVLELAPQAPHICQNVPCVVDAECEDTCGANFECGVGGRGPINHCQPGNQP